MQLKYSRFNYDLNRLANQIIEGLSHIENVKEEIRTLRKDEFEKTEQFEKRRHEFIKKKTQDLKSQIADTSEFILKITGLSYNADSERAEVYVKWPPKIKENSEIVRFQIDWKWPFYIDLGWVSINLENCSASLANDLKQSIENENISMKFTCSFSLAERNGEWRGIRLNI